MIFLPTTNKQASKETAKRAAHSFEAPLLRLLLIKVSFRLSLVSLLLLDRDINRQDHLLYYYYLSFFPSHLSLQIIPFHSFRSIRLFLQLQLTPLSQTVAAVDRCSSPFLLSTSGNLSSLERPFFLRIGSNTQHTDSIPFNHPI